MLSNLLYVFFPNRCLTCKEELLGRENYLCTFCSAELKPMYYGPIYLELLGNIPCFGLYRYEELSAIQVLIHHLKYQHKKHIGIELGYLLANSIPVEDRPELLLPVPITFQKKWSRGYNQSEWICKGFKACTKVPVQSEILQRIKHTESQTRLSKLARRNNVEGAFALAQSIPEGVHHVGIVDDVITTGATLQQVVRCLAEYNPKLRITIFATAIANH